METKDWNCECVREGKGGGGGGGGQMNECVLSAIADCSSFLPLLTSVSPSLLFLLLPSLSLFPRPLPPSLSHTSTHTVLVSFLLCYSRTYSSVSISS